MRKSFYFISVLCLLSMISIAEAHPHHKRVKKIQTIETIDPYAGLDLVSAARKFLGYGAAALGLPRSLWCADFMNKITGGGTGSRVAKSYLGYGRAASYGCVGCIAVMSRKGGGHVGVVSGYDKKGNPILISGNSKNRVREHSVSKHRVIAYRYK